MVEYLYLCAVIIGVLAGLITIIMQWKWWIAPPFAACLYMLFWIGMHLYGI